MEKIRVVIIEEHPAVRQALAMRLRSAAPVDLVGTTSNLLLGLHMVRDVHPDVVLLGCKGSRNEALMAMVELVQHIVEEDTAVMVLASYADEVEREVLLQAGATRYLLKDINTPQLLAEIENVRQKTPSSYVEFIAPSFPALPAKPILNLNPDMT
jgi:DNA-binding NarL/FixJ family response regulator